MEKSKNFPTARVRPWKKDMCTSVCVFVLWPLSSAVNDYVEIDERDFFSWTYIRVCLFVFAYMYAHMLVLYLYIYTFICASD